MTSTAYTHGHDESVLRSRRWRTGLNSAAYLLPHLEPGLSLLDVGRGPAGAVPCRRSRQWWRARRGAVPLPAWVRAAGFDQVGVISDTWCFRAGGERRWWGDLWADRTLRSATAAAVVDRGLATRKDLECIADGWRAWATDPDAVCVVPHIAILCRNPTERSGGDAGAPLRRRTS